MADKSEGTANILTSYRIDTLIDAAAIACAMQDFHSARDHLENLVALLRETSDRARLSTCLADLGEVVMVLKIPAVAVGHLEEALSLQRQLGTEDITVSMTLHRLGRVKASLGDMENARTYLLEARTTVQRQETDYRVGRALLRIDHDLGNLCFKQFQYLEARTHYQNMITWIRSTQPVDEANNRHLLITGLCDLGLTALRLDDDDDAVRQAEDALDIDREDPRPWHLLLAVRTKQQDWPAMQQVADQVYRRESHLRDPAYGAHHTLLILNDVVGNVPYENLLARHVLDRTKWFIAYAKPGHEDVLPPYNVVLNVVGDPDTGERAIAAATDFHSRCSVPFLNDPSRIPPTRRDRLPSLLADIDGLEILPTLRIPTSVLCSQNRESALRTVRQGYPLLLRLCGKHGGETLRRIETPEAMESECSGLPPLEFAYISDFRDYVSADNHYRKYRCIFVDRRPYPYHLAISSSWMVHYFSAEMEASPWKLEEERRFLNDPERVLGARAAKAIREVGLRIDLDYAGVDFTLLPDGSVLVFEANATMLVHPEDDDGPLAFKNPHVDRIYEAFDAMLERALGI